MEKDFYLQITGSTSIDKPLSKDKSYSIAFKEVDIYAVNESSGQGNADKVVFKGKSVDQVTILDEKEVIFGEPKKKSQSQALRRIIEQQYQEQWAGSDEYRDSESYYQYKMANIIEKEREMLI